ncbi:MAG: hypothetical protein HYY01_11385 [Chloroflexi bacterium]|nr:hypothetical protein [Chloroflexota bacterium]
MIRCATRAVLGLVAVSFLLGLALAACAGGKATPTSPAPPPTDSPAFGTTPQPGLTKNEQALAKYFKALHLWTVPAGREATAQDKSTPSESFTLNDAKLGLHIEATPDFVPGWKVTYRVDKRAFRGEGEEIVSLASLVTGPGVYDTTLDRPKDSGDYVIRVWLQDVLVQNLTFELK